MTLSAMPWLFMIIFFLISTLLLPSHGAYQTPAIPPRQHPTLSHSNVQPPNALMSRRQLVNSVFATTTVAMFVPTLSNAASSPASTKNDIVGSVRLATKALQALLDNWEDSVVDCNYADVPRELLDVKNKEELLEKASTFALFDKSVSVISCKTSNKKIRDYLGRTGIGPLVGLDKKLKQALTLDLIDDPDDLETYVQATENLQQALSRADSYSYTAGGDYSALNNFDKQDQAKVLEANGNLKQVQSSIQAAIDNLKTILKILEK